MLVLYMMQFIIYFKIGSEKKSSTLKKLLIFLIFFISTLSVQIQKLSMFVNARESIW